jgi:hypothetical protein
MCLTFSFFEFVKARAVDVDAMKTINEMQGSQSSTPISTRFLHSDGHINYSFGCTTIKKAFVGFVT